MCTHRVKGLRAAHCAACHRTFTGVRGFDMHRREFACLDPAAMTRQDGRALYMPTPAGWAVNAREQGPAPQWSEILAPAAK